MNIRLLAVSVLALVRGAAEVDLPRIGCWNEPGRGGEARVLYGVPGNLVVRIAEEGEGCDNPARFGDADDNGVRTLRINSRWRLAENAEGERFLLYRAAERYELPR